MAVAFCLWVWSIAYAQGQLKEVKSDVKSESISTTNTVIAKTTNSRNTSQNLIPHPLRATQPGDPQKIRGWLESQCWKGQCGSPLAPYAEQIAQSPYWSTILGICEEEEGNCVINAYGTNNLWGLMFGGRLQRYESLSSGIQAISNFLGRAETNNRNTIESFRGWYCQSACTNWESTVIRTKDKLESL